MNCFHFSVSLGYKTTFGTRSRSLSVLWIAFIFQYLWDTKQHRRNAWGTYKSCELLSFFSIFGIQNNTALPELSPDHVVNCFHFSVSLGYKTTNYPLSTTERTLWIAFIFQYLWDTKQPDELNAYNIGSCELLSFFSIFGIQNNSCCIIPFLD